MSARTKEHNLARSLRNCVDVGILSAAAHRVNVHPRCIERLDNALGAAPDHHVLLTLSRELVVFARAAVDHARRDGKDLVKLGVRQMDELKALERRCRRLRQLSDGYHSRAKASAERVEAMQGATENTLLSSLEREVRGLSEENHRLTEELRKVQRELNRVQSDLSAKVFQEVGP